ncbi:hypothetical protein [Polymorphobacter megasporae]|uniref:hypothetical protein n=1 Tax=Glacieibacterium megasporae TaxID=2835787 RepID=UPI001C1E4D91|nr:hypothetical protein [Polymorphobacter megasporae]UAJ08987.1 hypothetical protein KTC28_11520 [Polymorphobacter megasporae]
MTQLMCSLETTDPDVAGQPHAVKLGEMRALMTRHETEVLTSVVTNAEPVFRKGPTERTLRNLFSNDDGVTSSATLRATSFMHAAKIEVYLISDAAG